MIRVAHIVDDTSVGGVVRMLAAMTRHLGDDIAHEILEVDAQRLTPPRLSCDVAVVHFTASWSKLPFLLALRMILRRTPLVIVEHSYTSAFERLLVPRPARFRMMLRTIYALADRVVSVSHGQAAWLAAIGVIHREKIATICSIADLDRLLELPPPVRGQGPLRLGAYGRYAPQKGFDVLLAAMRLLPSGVATLRVAGLGPDAAKLEAMASRLGNTVVGGPIPDPAAWIADCETIVVPSRYEAFGLVALEARAAARPVIASAVDGLVEQVPSEVGMLVPPDDPDALAAALRRMAEADLGPATLAARRSAAGHVAASAHAWRRLFASLQSAPTSGTKQRIEKISSIQS